MFLDLLAGSFNVLACAMGCPAAGAGSDKDRRGKQGDYQTFDHISSLAPFDFRPILVVFGQPSNFTQQNCPAYGRELWGIFLQAAQEEPIDGVATIF
jgi:hypothetical protein